MSSLYITNSKPVALDGLVKALSFTPHSVATTGEESGASFVVTRVDDLALWGPARDDKSGLQVLLGGRIALEEAEWKRAESLPFAGGLACRWILDAWLNRREQFAATLNGAFLVVVIDPREKRLHVFTDRLGVFPIYHAPGHPLNLCSHPDVLADALRAQGHSCDIDWTTVAECLGTASGVQPFTYYRQIEELEPASHYEWSLGSAARLESRTTFWEPAYLGDEPSTDDRTMVEELAAALRHAARRRTLPRLGRPAVMLSGGADSRAILYGADDPSRVLCFTMYDEPNAELATASRLARVAGAEHIALPRSPDYYGETAADAVRIAGGMWSIADSHYLGFVPTFAAHNPGTVLTGCYADYMFKGLAFNRGYRSFLGRNLPLRNLAPFDFQFYHPHVRLGAGWQAKVTSRLELRFPAALRSDYARNALAIESIRIRPFIREADAIARTTLWRTLPWDPFLADSDVLQAYGRLSVDQKLNGEVFGRAVGRVIGPAARRIPNNNYGSRVDASHLNRVARFAAASAARKVGRVLGRATDEWKLATTGSWPNWRYFVAHSPSLAALWADPAPDERALFTDFLGRDPWATPIRQWAVEDHMLYLRLITVRIWLRQRRAL
jgi:asparagine synthase (glutamine-hydrolysing)